MPLPDDGFLLGNALETVSPPPTSPELLALAFGGAGPIPLDAAFLKKFPSCHTEISWVLLGINVRID